jgi:hypothetical protein
MAQKAVRAEMKAYHDQSSLFGRGMASEGYSGGYYDALCDVLLLLDGVEPNRRDYWRKGSGSGQQ